MRQNPSFAMTDVTELRRLIDANPWMTLVSRADDGLVAYIDTIVKATAQQPIPIYLVYFTAWEEGGALKRVADVYGYDRRHVAAENTP